MVYIILKTILSFLMHRCAIKTYCDLLIYWVVIYTLFSHLPLSLNKMNAASFHDNTDKSTSLFELLPRILKYVCFIINLSAFLLMDTSVVPISFYA